MIIEYGFLLIDNSNFDAMNTFIVKLCEKFPDNIFTYDFKLRRNIALGGILREAFIALMYEELRRFSRAFEIYCVSYVMGAGRLFKDCLETRPSAARIDGVLSFNYTDTYKRLYGRNNEKYCYVHGKAQVETERTNLIFGIDDNLQDGKENSAFAFAQFKKYFQRITLKTGSEYRDWIRVVKSNPGGRHEVFIIGHSLDRTDHEIFKEFFDLTAHGVIVRVLYHDDEAKLKLIQRTIEIVGKEALIERVHGADRTIRFVDQYDTANGLFIRR